MAEDKEGLAGYDEYNTFTNPDTRPREARGFQPDPMAQTVRDLPSKLLTQADENLTKNIVALTPKPKESQYGSIRMPRMSDDPMNAGNFILAGPIAVEEALGRFAAKALPAKTIETKLLQAGASKAELEARGVLGYLESQGTRQVHPLEVMKHLDDNPYQLNEIVKSGEKTPRQVFQLTYPDGTRVGAPFNTEEEATAALNDLRNPKAVLGRGQQEPIHITETLSERPISPPKFEQWQTPGGTNYREILLQAPPENTTALPSFEDYNRQFFPLNPPDTPQALAVAKNHYDGWIEARIRGPFTGGHFPEPDIIAHMRVNDRTLPSGEKALHVEEWQSDWSNRLREQRAPRGTTDTFDSFKTPSHPLVDNWQDLIARRTLKEAVDGGYDRLTWTTGQQQADRYDLAQHIKEVSVTPLRDGHLKGEYVLLITDHNGNQVVDDAFTLEKLPDVVGKDLARKIIADSENIKVGHAKHYTGLDLKVGGEWATKLYDESMVNRFNKIGKRYGVKAEDVPLGAGPEGRVTNPPNFKKQVVPVIEELHELAPESDMYHDALDKIATNMDRGNYHRARIEFDHWLGNYAMTLEDANPSIVDTLETLLSYGEGSVGIKVHSLKITPEMRHDISGQRFHPFADFKQLPKPEPKALSLADEATKLDPTNPVRYVGEQMGYPMFQQEPPGVGSFIQRPGETVADAFARAKARYQK